jgi:hypothetical protein
VADKFLIRQRYDCVIRYEALADKIDIEIKNQTKLDLDNVLHDPAVSRAAMQIGCTEEVTHYF